MYISKKTRIIPMANSDKITTVNSGPFTGKEKKTEIMTKNYEYFVEFHVTVSEKG